MSPFFYGLLVWLAAVNFAAAVITIYDKHQAKIKPLAYFGKKVYFFLSILGGGPGMYFTMKIIRHKTKRKKIYAWDPVDRTRPNFARRGMVPLGLILFPNFKRRFSHITQASFPQTKESV